MRRYVPWYAFGRVLDVIGPACLLQRWMDCETACCLDDGHEGVWYEFLLPLRFRLWRSARWGRR
jgi:hypothetical protein